MFAVDFLKGVAAVLAAATLTKGDNADPRFVDLCTATAAVFAVIGHSYPVWFRFRGGKGVATMLGTLFALNWIVAIIVCAVWYAVFQATRYVSVASIAAAVALPTAMAAMLIWNQLPSPVLLYFTLLLAALVIFRHRSNLSRLFKGNFREYSIERLIGFLTAFNRDVEIIARPHKRSGRNGKISFIAGRA